MTHLRWTWQREAALALAAVTACSSSEGGGGKGGGKANVEILGVDPAAFECESVATIAEIESALGGTFEVVDAQFTAPTGTARPCNYARRIGDTVEPWSFDLDCRKQALDDARALMADYAAGKTDAGSMEIGVGRGGLDHHGQALIFIDDDTPCYVRVHGPDAPGRLDLARLISERLTEATAPMRAIFRAR